MLGLYPGNGADMEGIDLPMGLVFPLLAKAPTNCVDPTVCSYDISHAVIRCFLSKSKLIKDCGKNIDKLLDNITTNK